MLQHVMMIATIWWCYKLLRRSAGTTVSFAAARQLALSADACIAARDSVGECRAVWNGGHFISLSTIARPGGFATECSPAVLPAGRHWPSWYHGGRSTVVLAIVMGPARRGRLRKFRPRAAAPALVCMPCRSWRSASLGSFALSNSVGRHLYNRAVADQYRSDRQAPATSNLLKSIAPLDPYGIPHWKIEALLKKKGSTDDQIETLMKMHVFEEYPSSALERLSATPFNKAGSSTS